MTVQRPDELLCITAHLPLVKFAAAYIGEKRERENKLKEAPYSV